MKKKFYVYIALIFALAVSMAPNAVPVIYPARPSTVVVAASNALNKSDTDYICTGTNDQTTLAAAVARLPAIGGKVLLSEGTYYIDAAWTPGKSFTLQGQGKLHTRLLLNNSVTTGTAIDCGNYAVELSDLDIDGGANTTFYGASGAGTRTGLKVSAAAIKSSVRNISIHGFDNIGLYIYTNNGAVSPAHAFDDIIDLNHIQIRYCYYALWMEPVTEYMRLSEIDALNCYYGIYVNGGNNNLSHCKILQTKYAIYVNNGDNNGHGNIIGCTMNHCAYGLFFNAITNGMNVTGCVNHGSVIFLYRSSGITITGCSFGEADGGNIIIQGGGVNRIADNYFGTPGYITIYRNWGGETDSTIMENNWDDNGKLVGEGPTYPSVKIDGAQTYPLWVTTGGSKFDGGVLLKDDSTTATNTSHYPPAQSATYVKATSTLATPDYYPYHTTDPTKSLTGTVAGNQWMASTNTNQRFHIDLGTAIAITRIYYENQAGGTYNNGGVKNFTFWGSNTAGDFADTTYADDGTWVQLTVVDHLTGQSQFTKHAAPDTADPQAIDVTNTTAYRYYAIKCADVWGGTDSDWMGLRRIELQTITNPLTPKLSVDSNARALYAADGTTPAFSWADTPGSTLATGTLSAGSLSYTMPFRGTAYKRFVLYLNGVTTSGATITFPSAFTQTPYVANDTATVTCTATTTTLTIPSITTKTGWIIVEGF